MVVYLSVYLFVYFRIRTAMDDCFWQYNRHLPIGIQQEIQEREMKLASSKQN